MENRDGEVRQDGREQHIDPIDALSDYLDRAIRGIFVFTFQRLPQGVWQTVSLIFERTFGLLGLGVLRIYQFLRVVFTWLFWELPKKVAKWFFESANYLFRLGMLIIQLFVLASIVFGPLGVAWIMDAPIEVAAAWCVFAVAASVWGMIYLGRGKWRVGQSINRAFNKLRFWRRNSSLSKFSEE